MTAVSDTWESAEPAPWLFRPPGVYRPQGDTWLLRKALAAAAMPRGARVLDLCTGTGALAVAAAEHGAGAVTAVDVSRRAVCAAWVNGRIRRLPVAARRGGLPAAVRSGPFDVVLANPPYVPSPVAAAGATRAWNAGPDGRAVLDPLCAAAPELLTRPGFLLMVQSAVADVDASLTALRDGGLKAFVVARARVPFGPVMTERLAYLRSSGLLEVGEEDEELVVIRADRP